MPTRFNFTDRVEKRQKEAKARQDSWDKLSYSEQLASLDARGMEAKRQRARILAKIQHEESLIGVSKQKLQEGIQAAKEGRVHPWKPSKKKDRAQ